MQAQFQSPQRVYFVLGSDSDVNWVMELWRAFWPQPAREFVNSQIGRSADFRTISERRPAGAKCDSRMLVQYLGHERASTVHRRLLHIILHSERQIDEYPSLQNTVQWNLVEY